MTQGKGSNAAELSRTGQKLLKTGLSIPGGKQPRRDRDLELMIYDYSVKSDEEQARKNHNKPASPNYAATVTNQMQDWTAQHFTQWLKGIHNKVDMEDTTQERAQGTVTDEANKVDSEDDDVLKYAEILYKCSLCTTLPCILTSQSAFLNHVREYHLATKTPGAQCQFCHLHFHTDTDLQAHLSDSHPDRLQESQEVSSEASDGTADDQQATEFGSEYPDQFVSTDDDKSENEDGKQFVNEDDESNRSAKDDRQQTDCEDEYQSAMCCNPGTKSDFTKPPTTHVATLEYHSSQHLNRLQRLTDQGISPPLHHQQTDESRRPLFSGIPDGTNGFPSFTPEFGRFTKLIREGGKIVYFCQVCNVKCQVKAAFQVHCNGLRHHHKVNMAGKNKVHLASPDSPRDSCVRTPLGEVSVPGPQMASLRGDNSFVSKMTKFFQDHPDVSAILNSSKDLNTSALVCSPLDFSLRAQCTEDTHHKVSRQDVRSPDQDCFYDKDDYAENSWIVSNHRSDFRHKHQPDRQNGSAEGMSKHCVDIAASKSEVPKQFSVLNNEQNREGYFPDLAQGSRKRTSAVAEQQSQASAHPESINMTRPSSASSINSSAEVPIKREERKHSDADVQDCGTAQGPSESKRPKLDISFQSRMQDSSDDQSQSGSYEESPTTTLRMGDYESESMTDVEKHSDKTETTATFSTEREEQKDDSDRFMQIQTKRNQSDERCDSTSVETRTSGSTTLSNVQQLSVPNRLPNRPVGSLQAHGVDLMDMMGKYRLSPGTGSSFYSRCLTSIGGFHGALAATQEPPPVWRGGVEGEVQDSEDVNTEMTRGQNNEGWKVTQIRDVLKGLLTASSKGSSVSRDMLLHRVSVVLHEPDVQQWGPACNRAVRDLYPHCLAQRKGKFKKTYFFGLGLLPGMESGKGDDPMDILTYRPLRDMTQDLEQLLEHLPGLLFWSGHVEHGVTRDDVLHVLAARLLESEVYQWGMQCNKALRMLFPLVIMKRKGKYKTSGWTSRNRQKHSFRPSRQHVDMYRGTSTLLSPSDDQLF